MSTILAVRRIRRLGRLTLAYSRVYIILEGVGEIQSETVGVTYRAGAFFFRIIHPWDVFGNSLCDVSYQKMASS